MGEFKFKSESAYFDIIQKEKISIILNVFVWMYLLSFLLWIRGVKTINLSESTSIATSTLSSSPVANPIRPASLYDSYFIYQAHQQQQHMGASPSINDSLLNSFELSVTSFCITHDFGLFLFKMFTLFMTLLRLVTLFANIFTSVCFHFKFRYEYLNAFRLSFNGRGRRLFNDTMLDKYAYSRPRQQLDRWRRRRLPNPQLQVVPNMVLHKRHLSDE